jgi:hypothetical protein
MIEDQSRAYILPIVEEVHTSLFHTPGVEKQGENFVRSAITCCWVTMSLHCPVLLRRSCVCESDHIRDDMGDVERTQEGFAPN